MANVKRAALLKQPISIKDKGTNEEFSDALKKAELLFENIEKSDKYQYAILSNGGKEWKREDHTLMYTDSKSKRVCAKPIQCDQVIFREPDKKDAKLLFKEGYIGFKRHGRKEFDGTSALGFGLMAYNGDVLIEPNYWGLRDLANTFIIGSIDGEVDNTYLLWDYSMNEWIRFKGKVEVYKTEWKLNDELVDMLIYCTTPGGDADLIPVGTEYTRYIVFLIHSGKLHYVMHHPNYGYSTFVDKNALFFDSEISDEYGTTDGMNKVFQSKLLMSMAREVTPSEAQKIIDDSCYGKRAYDYGEEN